MRVLVTISILSFCVLAWAALAIARHIRRTTTSAPQAASPAFASAAAIPGSPLASSATRKLRPQSPHHHDRTHAPSPIEDPGRPRSHPPLRKQVRFCQTRQQPFRRAQPLTPQTLNTSLFKDLTCPPFHKPPRFLPPPGLFSKPFPARPSSPSPPASSSRPSHTCPFPLPFTPVPLTLSDFAVVLVGLTLAPTTAFAALCLYLIEGASGLPVFSQHGLGGIAQLRGLTGGFLLSYPLAAALTSSLSRSYRHAFRSQYTANVLAAALGSALLMLGGLCWFAVSLHLIPAAAFKLATLPFLPGQLIKVLAAAGIVTSARALRRA